MAQMTTSWVVEVESPLFRTDKHLVSPDPCLGHGCRLQNYPLASSHSSLPKQLYKLEAKGGGES